MSEKTIKQYDETIKICRQLMINKNHDYGESWRSMRPTSITDQIATKVERIKRIEDLQLQGESPKVSEGIEGELMDIINYAVFELIMLAFDE